MRKTLAHTCVAAAALACAAPALAAPAADFEQRLPAAQPSGSAVRASAAGHRGERFTTRAIRAPRQFDLVGLAGEMREIELRVRDRGRWSAWKAIEGGDPLYTGGARVLQMRTSGFRPRGRLHYVDLASPRRSSASTAPAASAPVARGAAARLAPVPPIMPRSGWGANNASGGCQPRSGASYGTVLAASVHHTVSTVDYTPAEAAGIVLGICRYHVNGNGWNDIGYSALVDQYGVLYEGRAGGIGSAVVGAHTEGYNSQTTGIASVGDHTSVPITPAATDSLVNFLAWKLDGAGAVPATGAATLLSAGGATNRYGSGSSVTVPRIFGHGTTNNTACPGATLAPLLPTIAQRVQAVIDGTATTARRKPKRKLNCKRFRAKKKRRQCFRKQRRRALRGG